MTQKHHHGPQFGFDARGLPRLEERVDEGQYQPILNNTQLTRRLKADELSLVETQRNRALKNDSYAAASAAVKKLKARSRLDYMRALSESIKRNRELQGAARPHLNRLRWLLRKLQDR